MKYEKSKFQQWKAVMISLAAALFVGMILSVISSVVVNNGKQRERLVTVERFVNFQGHVQELIFDNMTLLKGFEAYIKSNDDMKDAEAYEYLDYLLKEKMEYIRNVGIIRDTTIIWNYPREGNESAIGVDLAKVEGQKQQILKVKNEQTPIFQGPITLVQGGEGYIVRLPVIDARDEYWGQISIVLKADKLEEAVGRFADDADLQVEIYNVQNGQKKLIFANGSMTEDALIFQVDPNLIDWEVHAIPQSGWSTFQPLAYIIFGIFGLITLLSGTTVYIALKNHYEIQHMSIHDKLTGLYNRNFLEDYSELILTASKRHGYNIGLILLDLDNFKAVNDRFGHKMGDDVLVETGRIMKSVSRGDETVFRMGGDEFLIVIPNLAEPKSMTMIKERLHEAFDTHFFVEGCSLKMLPSIGWAVYPQDGNDFEALMEVADTRMYNEKKARKTGR